MFHLRSLARRLRRQQSLIAIFCTVLMVMMGFGIFIPVLPFYVGALGGSGRELGFLTAVYSVTQLLFSPVWGDVSDRIGRRPVLLIGIAGCAVTQVLYGLSSQLWMLYGARIVAGAITSAVFPTAMAFIADTTSGEERSSGMGLVTAAMYTGMMLGPGLGGWLAHFGLAIPFFGAAAFSAIVLLFVWVTVPESLQPEQRSRTAASLPGSQLVQALPALRGSLGRLFLLTLVYAFAMSQFWSIFGLYAAKRYGYGPEQVGGLMAAMGVGSAFIQALLVGRIARWWGEDRVVRGALIASAGGFAAMMLAISFPSVLVTTCLFVMASSLVSPMIASQISRRASHGQGTALGLNNSFMAFGQVIGPIWAGFTLDVNVLLPFASGAVAMAAGVATAIIRVGGVAGRSPQADPISGC